MRQYRFARTRDRVRFVHSASTGSLGQLPGPEIDIAASLLEILPGEIKYSRETAGSRSPRCSATFDRAYSYVRKRAHPRDCTGDIMEILSALARESILKHYPANVKENSANFFSDEFHRARRWQVMG